MGTCQYQLSLKMSTAYLNQAGRAHVFFLIPSSYHERSNLVALGSAGRRHAPHGLEGHVESDIILVVMTVMVAMLGPCMLVLFQVVPAVVGTGCYWLL